MTLTLPAGPYLPNSDLVAVAWLVARVAQLDEQIVGNTLPKDTTKWAATGFLQVHSIPGGRTADVDLPRRLPVLQLDAWGTTTGAASSSNKPVWNRAWRLIELVREATEAAQTGHYGEPLEMLKPNYRPVRVQSAYLLNEPGRVDDDPAGYAHVTADLAIDWVPA